MPKLKTHKGAAKRFRLTGKGKVKYRRANRRHNFTDKTAKKKLARRSSGLLKECDAPGVKRLLKGS